MQYHRLLIALLWFLSALSAVSGDLGSAILDDRTARPLDLPWFNVTFWGNQTKNRATVHVLDGMPEAGDTGGILFHVALKERLWWRCTSITSTSNRRCDATAIRPFEEEIVRCMPEVARNIRVFWEAMATVWTTRYVSPHQLDLALSRTNLTRLSSDCPFFW